MSGYLARRAEPADLPEVLRIIHAAADWLHARGLDQWPHTSPTLGPASLGAQIGRGEMWLACTTSGDAVATIAVSPSGDPDFWSPAELRQPAWYVAKMATARARAPRGLGGLLLRWVLDRAAASGIPLARLDVWKTNAGLQDWYRRQGWEYLRTVDAPGRNSGALFECRTALDFAARNAFAGCGGASFAAGDRVLTSAGPGIVEIALPPSTGHEVDAPSSPYPMWCFWVKLDTGETVVRGAGEMQAAPVAPAGDPR